VIDYAALAADRNRAQPPAAPGRGVAGGCNQSPAPGRGEPPHRAGRRLV